MRYEPETKKKLEVELILSVVNQQYGYDFRQYSRDSLIRRIEAFCRMHELSQLSEVIPLLIWKKDFFNHFLGNMTIGVTEFFRDSCFYRSFSEHVLPSLATFPYIKIWHAGCSSGEEVYSTAILLKRHGLIERCIIYGTDINMSAIDRAKSGIYPIKLLENAKHPFYSLTEGENLSDYYHSIYSQAMIDRTLTSKVTFSHHNLVSDQKFGEMNVIFCRNVMIYFEQELRDRVLSLLTDSLRYGGYICFGKGESLFQTSFHDSFEVVDLKERIYRKKLPQGHVGNE